MPTLLDLRLANVVEQHDGTEPRVVTADVQAILARKIRPGDEDAGESVALIAERAKVSTRTVYRVLNPSESKETISLELADKLCVAAEGHLKSCRLKLADGSIVRWDGTPDRKIAVNGSP